MPFFLIIPAWLLCLAIGGLLACCSSFRRAGVSLILVSTGGTIASLLLSTGVLYLATLVGLQHFETWTAGILIGGYLLAILVGGWLGCRAGLALSRKLLTRRSVAS